MAQATHGARASYEDVAAVPATAASAAAMLPIAAVTSRRSRTWIRRQEPLESGSDAVLAVARGRGFVTELGRPETAAARRLNNKPVVSIEESNAVHVYRPPTVEGRKQLPSGAAAEESARGEPVALRENRDARRMFGEHPPTRIALNQKFHTALLAGGHNRYLVKSLRSLWDVFRTATSSPLSYPGRLETALSEHERIIAALEKRDPDAAETALREHASAAQKIRLRLLLEEEHQG